MAWIREYILSVVAAAIICAIVKSLAGEKSTPSVVVKLLAGLLMAMTVVAPLVKVDSVDISSYINSFHADADDAVQKGIAYSAEETAAIIKDNTRAYILDKAETLGATLEVEVTLTDAAPQVPCAVQLRGRVSPYAKQRLMQYIADDLGIAEENQIWT